ncbi:hypothetical protein AUJ17_05645 [Candidatus Micrarchaeota archaeon CG1_02_47_40]|nr:MAG: hypothetical protein AUJ17_05645 [Candidatus Micrarchaeota archaeon CG1_02_47_40]
MPSFSEILQRRTIFRDKDVLSPHYVPDVLPFREGEVEKIMLVLSGALKGMRAGNLFIYGKTGTGKTCSVRHVMKKFMQMESPAKTVYLNCRIYNSKYKVMHKIAKEFIPELEKSGFGISLIYEKLIEWLAGGKIQLIVVLDEIDMVKDLNELVYTLVRTNDELLGGGISVVGISNRLSFKEMLDPRSKSSLCETELTFAPYDAEKMKAILKQRLEQGFVQGAVDESALNLAAAIAATESGDARYALRLLLRAGEIVDAGGGQRIDDSHVEEARRSVEGDMIKEVIQTLPENQRIVLYAVANLSQKGGRYSKLGGNEDGENFLLSGEVYEEYSRVCNSLCVKKRSARWYREYLNELEMLGLITTIESGRGMRGHTRLIKPGYPAEELKKIVWETMGLEEEGKKKEK